MLVTLAFWIFGLLSLMMTDHDLHANLMPPSPYWVITPPKGIALLFLVQGTYDRIPCANCRFRGKSRRRYEDKLQFLRDLLYQPSDALKALTFTKLPAFFTAQGILDNIIEYLGIDVLSNTVRPSPVKSIQGIQDNLSPRGTSKGKQYREARKDVSFDQGEVYSKRDTPTGEFIPGNRNISLYKTVWKKAVWKARWINETSQRNLKTS